MGHHSLEMHERCIIIIFILMDRGTFTQLIYRLLNGGLLLLWLLFDLMTFVFLMQRLVAASMIPIKKRVSQCPRTRDTLRCVFCIMEVGDGWRDVPRGRGLIEAKAES